MRMQFFSPFRPGDVVATVKEKYYRRLASANRRIVDARDRIDLQKALVIELSGRRERRDAVVLLRALKRSLRLMLYQRALLIRQLMNWPR